MESRPSGWSPIVPAGVGRAAADTLVLATRYTDTAVETVSLKEADALAKRLAAWMEAR